MSDRKWSGAVVIGLLLLAGCNDRENFMVRVTFPDDTARDQAKRLWVAAIGPGEGYGCDELRQGQAVPGDAGYTVESEVSFDWPAAGEIRGLEDVTAGRKLFYAEAEDENREVILRGCTEAQVGDEESRQVTIALEWVSQPCQVDGDCDDSNDCTQDSCDDLDGCVNLPLMAGTDCGICAACDGQGVCIDDLTQDLDCALCQECRPAGTCMYQAAGSDVKGECANEMFCDGAESCDGAGGCQAGGDPCPGLNCNEDSDSCEGCQADTDCPPCQECDAGDCVNQTAGTACDDGDSCSLLDACDGAGVCVSGATDKDTDGDSYYDEACPGGDDCDDGAISVNPGATEGPAGDATCGDLVDNDCNGQTDGGDPACSDWWDPAWRTRIKLGFENSAQSEVLSGFPVRVSLDVSRIDYTKTQDAGQDLRFIDADGATVLYHEIEAWDEGGTSEIWVRVVQIEALTDADFMWLYFDNDAAGDGQGASSVWDAEYIGVWHLSESVVDEQTGGIHSDSTSNGNDAVQNGNTNINTQIASAQQLDGVDDYLEFPSDLMDTVTDFTFSAWVFWEGSSAWQRIFDFGDGPASSTTGQYMFCATSSNDGTMIFSITLAGYSNSESLHSIQDYPDSTWIYLTVSLEGNIGRMYWNGSEENTLDTFTLTPSVLGATRNWAGRSQYTGDPHFGGMIDEVRLAGVSRTVGWIAAQYLSVSDSLISYGNPETAP